jgi:FHS family glucose/mannose:H+ symporter-like MFS transporter
VRIKNKINDFYLVNNATFTLIAVSMCKFLYGFYTSAIGSILVPLGAAFNINIRTQSIIFPFNYFGQIVIIFFVGYFADKLGKKVVQTVSLVLLSIFALSFNYANNFILFMIMVLFMGLFGTSINTIADAAVSDTFKNKKGYYLNIAHVFFGLGAMTSPIVFNLVFKVTGDFRRIYFILFIISILIIFLISIAKYPAVDNEKIRPSVILELLKNKSFIVMCIFAMLSSGAQHSVSGFIPTLFQKNLNISAQISNYSLSFFWLSIVAGRVAAAFLSRRFKEYFLLKILNFATFFVLAASFFLDNYVLLLIDYLIFGLLLGGIFPLIIAYSAEISPKYTTSRLAVVFSFTAMGMFIVPTIVGMLADYFLIYKVLAFTSIPFLAYIFVFGRKTGKVHV